MKLISQDRSSLSFSTGSGCTFSRPRLLWTGWVVQLEGWAHPRNLYRLEEADRENFPQASWRVELGGIDQEDPLFVAAPCWLKPGTKHQLVIQSDDDLPPTQVRVTKWSDWRGEAL